MIKNRKRPQRKKKKKSKKTMTCMHPDIIMYYYNPFSKSSSKYFLSNRDKTPRDK